MTIARPPLDLGRFRPEDAILTGCRGAGQRLAQSIVTVRPRGNRGPRPGKGIAKRVLARGRASREKARAWLLENARLLQTAEREALELAAGLHQFPVAYTAGSEAAPRVSLIAGAYLNCSHGCFTEESILSFLEGFQASMPLEMGEVWGVKPALQLEILKRLEAAEPSDWPSLVTSLRRIGETDWKELFEAASLVHRTLTADPEGVFARMDFESRDYYLNQIGRIAKFTSKSELEVATEVVYLARTATGPRRRRHVGYYLVDRGVRQLRERVAYRTPLRERVADIVLGHPAAFYLGGILLLTLLLVGAALPVRWLAALVLVFIPATQAAVDFVQHLVTWLVRPRILPKLDFSDGIPRDCTTMVAVPILLLKEDQVRDMVRELEIRFLANRDPNLYFALLTDSPDADAREDERDRLVDLCQAEIEALNRRYRGSPFFLFHRHRIYNDSEGRWMGWERKRGKLLDLNRVMRGGFDAFPVKVGNLQVLPRVKYVLTLDADTQLPRETAARLVGAMAHPLNAAVVDPERKIVVEGYGIMQPRIGISIHSSSRSRLARFYSGETGFDIYTRAVSDVYQDLFGEGIFTGKGIYEVDVIREVLEHRFPENALLSHDLIEGAYARVGLVTDIELIDDYPSHFSAYNRRKHRWVRGDWQILRWILGRVPGYDRKPVENPISVISRWKIMDNLRRSLIEPALVALLAGGWFLLPGPPVRWTILAAAMLFFPVYCDLFFALLRVPLGSRRAFVAWARDTARNFARGHAIAAFSLTFLLHQALVSLDAIARSVMRVFVTKRRLLEWETAAEAEAEARSKATVDRYLEWTPWISAAIALALCALRPGALPAAVPVLILWCASYSVSNWLNQAPRVSGAQLSTEDTDWLRLLAERTCHFFHEWNSPATNHLIPDSVREDGESAMRLSPTNLGMLLNAGIAELELGLTTPAEFKARTQQTLATVRKLARYRGHLYNWYDIRTLEPLEPRFVSAVDSGNLAAALWTLKQAALAHDMPEVAALCHDLVQQMDFRFLYNPRKKVLAIGCDADTAKTAPSGYDLLASEARIAVFVAIAKGDIPQEAWFHLGRAHTVAAGEKTLLSWTGTMFEYLMPALWMRHHTGTIMEQSIRGAVRVQQAYARRKGVPWGISESACLDGDTGEYGYAPFGIPAVALQKPSVESLVVAPYASALALAVDPVAAVSNLRDMEEKGWCGRYGFFEAVDFSRPGGEVIRSWMAHHQGMTLLAVCNVLCDRPIERYFHAEPQVQATELLLNERVPAGIPVESQPEEAEPAVEPPQQEVLVAPVQPSAAVPEA